MAQKGGKDWRIGPDEKLPEIYSKGADTDEFICIAPKGCYHMFKFWDFGDEAIRRSISKEHIPIPRHFAPKTKELALKVNDLKRKQSLPVMTLRGEEL